MNQIFGIFYYFLITNFSKMDNINFKYNKFDVIDELLLIFLISNNFSGFVKELIKFKKKLATLNFGVP